MRFHIKSSSYHHYACNMPTMPFITTVTSHPFTTQLFLFILTCKTPTFNLPLPNPPPLPDCLPHPLFPLPLLGRTGFSIKTQKIFVQKVLHFFTFFFLFCRSYSHAGIQPQLFIVFQYPWILCPAMRLHSVPVWLSLT